MNQRLHVKKCLLLYVLLFSTMTSFSQVREQWVRRFSSSDSAADNASDIKVDAQGYVYVTGSSGGGILTIKYNASGNQIWTKRYERGYSGAYYQNAAAKLAVDAAGNVYITGSDYSGLSGDYVTIKYDEAGNQSWIRKYNGQRNGNDAAFALDLDALGNVYVTGSGGTVKYDKDGHQLWQRGGGNDIVVDASGNVYVTGNATIKYDTNGKMLWTKTNDFPAAALAIDIANNVYATGSIYNSEPENESLNYATVKYNADGDLLWLRQYDSKDGSSEDNPVAIVVDAKGNVYVTGTLFDDDDVLPWGQWIDYLTVKYDANGNLSWARSYGTPIPDDGESHDIVDQPTAIVVDKYGNVYVTGVANNQDRPDAFGDYATIKYDSNGNQVWVEKYNGPVSGADAADGAAAIAVDAAGNVYVTGGSEGIGTRSDYATIKYTQAAPLKVEAGADKTLYLGYGTDCMTLMAKASEGIPPYKYRWSPAGGTASSILVCPTTTTTYKVMVTDAAGNTASDKVKVTVIDVRCGHKNNKVLVCHKGKTLCIAASAVAAHLKHGDKLGSCTLSPALTATAAVSDGLGVAKEIPNHLSVFTAPNPFATATTLHFFIPSSGYAVLEVYDVSGMLVERLFSGNAQAGQHQVMFNASRLANGLYVAKLTTVAGTVTCRLIKAN